jgi:hypothetical protein
LLANALSSVAQKSNVLKQGLMARRIKNEMERARALDGARVIARPPRKILTV